MILVNGVKFNDEEFHNGEVIFKKPCEAKSDKNVIEMYFKDNRDITALLFARQWLLEEQPNADCNLIMKYCPYERMDRPINNQLFSMKLFAGILDKFKFNNVFILDPHSQVCVDLLETVNTKVHIIDLESYVQKVIDDFNPDYICYPDKGANSKYPKVLTGINIPYFYGQKTRDLNNNGVITSYELVDAPDLTGKKVLIIDDICCLGGTAYNASVQMKLAGAKEVAFYISHCEEGVYAGKIFNLESYKLDFSEGTTLRTAGLVSNYIIDKVYTANTMNIDIKHKNIKIVG